MATRLPVTPAQLSRDRRLRITLSDGRVVVYPEGTPPELAAEDLFRRFPEERQFLSRSLSGDFFKGVQQGAVAGTVGFAGDLYSLATGNRDNPVSLYARKKQEEIGQNISLLSRIQAEESQQAIEDAGGTGFTETARQLATSPGYALTTGGNIAGSLGTAVAMGGGAGLATRLGTRGLAKQAADRVATGAAVGTGSTQHGAMTGGAAFGEYLKLPDEFFQSRPEFQEYLKRHGNPVEAKNQMALDMARNVAFVTGAVSAAGTYLVGAPLERIVTGGRGAAGATTAGRGALSVGAREAGQEAIFDEGFGQFATNVGASRFDPSQPLEEGVGGAALLGALGGGPFGVAAGAIDATRAGTEARAREAAERVQAEREARLADPSKWTQAELFPNTARRDAAPDVPEPEVVAIPKRLTTALEKATASLEEAKKSHEDALSKYGEPDDDRMRRYEVRVQTAQRRLDEATQNAAVAERMAQVRAAGNRPQGETAESEAERMAYMRGEREPLSAEPTESQLPLFPDPVADSRGQLQLFDQPPPEGPLRREQVSATVEPDATLQAQMQQLVNAYQQAIADGDLVEAQRIAGEYEALAREANLRQLPLPTSRVSDPTDWVDTQRSLFPEADPRRPAGVVDQLETVAPGVRQQVPRSPGDLASDQLAAAAAQSAQAEGVQPVRVGARPQPMVQRPVSPEERIQLAADAARRARAEEDVARMEGEGGPSIVPARPAARQVAQPKSRAQMLQEVAQRVEQLRQRDARQRAAERETRGPLEVMEGEGPGPVQFPTTQRRAENEPQPSQSVPQRRANRSDRGTTNPAVGGTPASGVQGTPRGTTGRGRGAGAQRGGRDGSPSRDQSAPASTRAANRRAAALNPAKSPTKQKADTETNKKASTESDVSLALQTANAVFEKVDPRMMFLPEVMTRLTPQSIKALAGMDEGNAAQVAQLVYDQLIDTYPDGQTPPPLTAGEEFGQGKIPKASEMTKSKRMKAALDNLGKAFVKSEFDQNDAPLPESALSFVADSDAYGVLSAIVEDSKASPFNKAVARRLLALPGLDLVAIDVTNIPRDENGNIVPGRYFPESMVIELDLTHGLTTNLFLHELTHAATMYAIVNPTPEQKPIVDRLEAMRQEVEKNVEGAYHYGLKDVAEFVSEAMSSSDFQAVLYNMKRDGRTMFRRIVDAIKELLGLAGTDNALGEAVQLIEQLIGPPRSTVAPPVSGPPVAPTQPLSVVDQLRPKRNALTSKIKAIVAQTKEGNFSYLDPLHDYLAPIERVYINDPQLSGQTGLRPDVALRLAQASRGVAARFLSYGNVSFDNNAMPRVMEVEDTKNTMQGVIDGIKDAAKQLGISAREANDIFHAAVLANRAAVMRDKYGMNILPANNEQIDEGVRLFEAPENQWIRDTYARFRTQNDAAVRFLAETGAIDPDQAQMMLDASAYVPFHRVIEQTGAQDTDYILTGSFLHAGELKKIKGGFLEVENVVDNMAANTAMMIEMGIKRHAVRHTLNAMEHNGLAKRTTKADEKAIKVYENGREVYWRVKDPELYQSLLGVPDIAHPILKAASVATRAVRVGVTLNPVFVIKELIRGPMQLWLTSQAGGVTPFGVLAKTMRNFAQGLAGKNEAIKEMRRYGVAGGYEVFDTDVASVPKSVGAISGISAIARLLRHASEAADSAVRATLYQERINAGDPPALAAYRALELINYHRKGTNKFVTGTNFLVPFQNAAIQGLSMEMRTLFGNNAAIPIEERNLAARRIKMRLAMLAAAGLAYAASWDGEDDYERASEGERDANWFVKVGDDKTLRIPVPYGIGYAFKALGERTYRLMANKPDSFRHYVRNVVNNFVPSTDLFVSGPAITRPITEIVFNYDSFREAPVVPEYLKGLRNADQFDERTSTTARVGSAATGYLVSPMQFDHLIRGYTASLGVSVTALIDSALRTTGAIPDRPAAMSRGIKDTPILGDFFRNPTSDAARRDYSEFVASSTAYKAAINRAEKEGRYTDAMRLRDQNAVLLKFAEATKQIQNEIKRINERERELRFNSSVDPMVLRRLNDRRSQLIRQALAIQRELQETE